MVADMTPARSRSSRAPVIGSAVDPKALMRGAYEFVSVVKGFASLFPGPNHLLDHPLEGLHKETMKIRAKVNTAPPFIHGRLTAH